MSKASPREQLGRRLREYRTTAGLRGAQVAAHLGTDQSRISRIETGKTRIDVDEVKRWLEYTHAPSPVPDKVMEDELAFAEMVEVQVATWREVNKDGDARAQKKYLALEATANPIRIYQPSLIPGLLQTAGYIAHVQRDMVHTREAEIPGIVSARLARQKRLYEPDARIEVVVAEHVLRQRGGGAVMRYEQLRRIAEVALLPSVDFRVIPLETDMALAYNCQFELMEMAGPNESTVYIELPHREMREDKPGAVEEYRELFLAYQEVALAESHAIALVDSIAQEIARGIFSSDTPPQARDGGG